MSTTVVNARTVKNPQPNVDYVYIGRPSKWGNPFRIGRDGTRDEVIAKYRRWVERQPDLMDSLWQLRGMRLGCYCYPMDCHGDVLAELADAASHRQRRSDPMSAAIRNTRPRLLDLFCGAGGAAVGYHRAGFDVVGVDLKFQRDYPFEFHLADAMEYPLGGFDVIHASPPCQKFSITANLARAQGRKASEVDLLTPLRPKLRSWATLFRGVYVIENVPGAPIQGITLCGSSFGLKVKRHRIFESNLLLHSLPCDHKAQGRPIGVYQSPGDSIPHGGRTAKDLAEGLDAMGIDWMRWASLKEAIPPAYTEFIGAQLIRAVTVAA